MSEEKQIIKHVQVKLDLDDYLSYMGLTLKSGTNIQEDLYNHIRKRIQEYDKRESKKQGV